MEPDAAVPSVVPSGLSLDWVLPETARLSWVRSGEEGNYFLTRLVVGPTVEDVVGRTPAAVVSDGATYPGLAFWELPESDTETDAVRVFGLEAGRGYFAQIEIEDERGARAVSDVLAFDTPASYSGEIVLFDEVDTAGYSIPPELVLVEGDARSGSFAYEFSRDCGGEEWCFENLRRQNVGVDLTPIGADFDRAYIEMFIEIDGPRPSYWSQLRLWIEPGGTDALLFAEGGITLPAGIGYTAVQIPLTELTSGGAPLSATTAAAGLFEWGIGGQWPDQAAIRIDDVRIRY